MLQTAPEPGLTPIEPVDADFLSSLFDRLFPITRSITGPGLRESLDVFGGYMPLRRDRVTSGTAVFDWIVPPEWALTRALLTGPDGQVIADSDRSNVQVVNYSIPVDVELDLEDLQPHLHSIPDQPDLIPYVTSYYRDSWGFCLSHTARQALKPGRYRAVIQSRKYDGAVDFADCVLPGETGREVMLTSYLCHPSLANNELSGPLVLLGLFDRISRWKRRRFSYRFVLAPETIGSLCYLFRHGDQLKDSLAGGLVLTCLGGPAITLSYKTSRRGTSTLDALVARLGEDEGYLVRPFSPTSGSDERQFCSPGFNLPMGQMGRTLYGDYAGYHTSGDDKAFMGIAPLVDAIDRIEALLRRHEYAGIFVNQAPYGEAQLGRRGLYPSVNSPTTWATSSDKVVDSRTLLNRILTILSDCDGEHRMIDIAARLECSLDELMPVVDRLEAEGLLKAAGR
jgi:aminopeptidase-like protein